MGGRDSASLHGSRGIHIAASQTNALRSLLEKSHCPAGMVNRPWSTSSSDAQTGRPLIVLTAASCFRVGQLLVHRKKVGEGIRFESWSSKKYKATTTNKTANNVQATLFMVRENHISFSRPTAFQEARSLSRCTQTNWFCTQRAFRPTGKRSSPTHSGPRGK